MLFCWDIEISRLEDAGYGVGIRMLELLCHREKVTLFLIYNLSCFFIVGVWCSSIEQVYVQANKREIRLLGILSFVHSTLWRSLFGKVSIYYQVILLSLKAELSDDCGKRLQIPWRRGQKMKMNT